MTGSNGGDAAPILCVGALICDLMLDLAALPAGPGKFLARGARLVAAGMATSAATAVARLGRPAALWASVGDDMIGDFLLAEVGREGIDTAAIRRVAGAGSALSAILTGAAGERAVMPYYDPLLLAPPATLPAVLRRPFGAVLADVRWPSAAALALDAARAAGIPAILDLDVGPADILAGLAPRATHVAASLAGAAVLTGATDCMRAAEALSSHAAAATIVVTDGENGLAWVEPGRSEVGIMPAFAVAAVDTNAAGDVFHGALAVLLAEGMALPAALRFASAAAAIKCTRRGGRLGAPGRGEVEAFLAAAAVRRGCGSRRGR